MDIKIIALVLLAIQLTFGDRILVVMDNKELTKTHSKFLGMLENSHSVEIAYSFAKKKIELKNYDRFKYDHVIVMCLSDKESASQIKVNDIVSYFDEGGNVIVVGDIDTSRSYRRLFYSFGVEPDEFGSKVKDYFNYHSRTDVIQTTNYVGAPFISTEKPLLYQGVGLNLVNFENYQLYELVASEPTALSRNYIQDETQRVGRMSLVVGVQGLNNARAILLGSLGFFSNSALEETQFGNEQATKDLLAWTFKNKGVLRVTNMHYHGQGTDNKESLFNVGEKIYFDAVVQIQKGTQWEPYSTNDLQVEFVMLDPWVRIPLVQKSSESSYHAQFYAPTKEGIYQFKIIYRKPGYSFLSESQRVTLRPYKHDEYERFLYVASPYFFGMGSTIIATFVFIVFYLYSGFETSKAKMQ